MKRRFKITQEEYDGAIADAYKLGYQTGQIAERNKQWVSQADGLTLVEKQVLVILQRMGVQ